mgnify:CR=1 FL=1
MYIGYNVKAEIHKQIGYIKTSIALLPNNIKVKNRYKNILRNCKQKEIVEQLYQSITYIQTAMNRINRVLEKDAYITTREDVIVSLNIIYNLLEENKKDKANTEKKEAIKELLQEEKKETNKDLITRKELQKLLRLSKTQTHRIVEKYIKEEVLQLVEIKGRIHYYKFTKPNETTNDE